jgi:hypothetical protein
VTAKPSFPLDFPSRTDEVLIIQSQVPTRTTRSLHHHISGPLDLVLSSKTFIDHLKILPSIQLINIDKMSPMATRAALRQSRFLIRRTAIRHNSSTTEAANKAKQAAEQATSKASEGLSKVSSSAGPAIAGAAQNVGNALRKVGGPVGKVVTFVERKYPSPLAL